MSSSPPNGDNNTSRAGSKTLSSVLWSTLSSFLPPSFISESSSSPSRLDMADITYLMDMDGEGLCYHQLHKSSQSFKKS